MSELKNCPFCGNEDLKIDRMKWNNLTDWIYIRCKKCTANIRHFDTKLAIERWNTRYEK